LSFFRVFVGKANSLIFDNKCVKHYLVASNKQIVDWYRPLKGDAIRPYERIGKSAEAEQIIYLDKVNMLVNISV